MLCIVFFTYLIEFTEILKPLVYEEVSKKKCKAGQSILNNIECGLLLTHIETQEFRHFSFCPTTRSTKIFYSKIISLKYIYTFTNSKMWRLRKNQNEK